MIVRIQKDDTDDDNDNAENSVKENRQQYCPAWMVCITTASIIIIINSQGRPDDKTA